MKAGGKHGMAGAPWGSYLAVLPPREGPPGADEGASKLEAAEEEFTYVPERVSKVRAP